MTQICSIHSQDVNVNIINSCIDAAVLQNAELRNIN